MAELSPPHVHLGRFPGLTNKNWDQSEGLLRDSIAVSRIPARNDLDNSLRELRNRYAGADQRNFELDLQSRKFDPIKEQQQPEDFPTDIQRLANLVKVDDDDAGIDCRDERKRGTREQFIQGIPFRFKKVLLKENVNIVVN